MHIVWAGEAKPRLSCFKRRYLLALLQFKTSKRNKLSSSCEYLKHGNYSRNWDI